MTIEAQSTTKREAIVRNARTSAPKTEGGHALAAAIVKKHEAMRITREFETARVAPSWSGKATEDAVL
jgi:hypothetical protein